MKIKLNNSEISKGLLLIFAFAQALLVANPSVESILLMLTLTVGLTFLLSNEKEAVLTQKLYILVALLQVFCSVNFYWTWNNSSKVKLIAEALHIPSAALIGITAVLFAFLGYWFLINLIKNCLSIKKIDIGLNKQTLIANDCQTWKQQFLFCFVCAFMSVTICSENSILYPINSWTDPHCFMTVGKAMMNGMVPYRDLLEQKGPILYFVYGLTWLFCKNTYLGIFILEIIAASFFLYYTSKTVSLYKKGKENLAILLTAFLIYSSLSFRTGGTAEELCIPLLAYALYLALSFLRDYRDLTWENYIVMGLSAGLVFWIKYTFAGFYLGWMLFLGLDYIKHRNIVALQRMISGLCLGFALVTLPVFVYFGYHHALHDLAKVYFYDNIFLYTDFSNNPFFEAVLHYGKGLCLLIRGNYPALILICIGCFWEKNGLLSLLFMTLFATSFIGWRTWNYYALIFAPFISVGLAVILDKITVYRNRVSTKSLLALLCLLCLLFTPNHRNIGKSKESTPQYQFAKIIRTSDNPTLLNYGFLDGGFYWAADILPNCKAFCKLMNPIEEMLQLQEEYVREGTCEFVVTRGMTLDKPLYKLVSKNKNYFLYRKISETISAGNF